MFPVSFWPIHYQDFYKWTMLPVTRAVERGAGNRQLNQISVCTIVRIRKPPTSVGSCIFKAFPDIAGCDVFTCVRLVACLNS